MYTKRFDDRPARRVPGWALGTALAAVAALTGVALMAGDDNGPVIQHAAAEDTITGTVAVDGLNVRAVDPGSTDVDLTAAPLTTLSAGTTVTISCQFTGTEVTGEGSEWYQVQGAGIPAVASGTAVAFAPYLTVGAGAAVPACGTAVAVPQKPAPSGYGKAYVALGDSFSSGEGAKDYFPETNKTGNECHRSPHSYAALYAKDAGYTDFAFLACSGAVTDNVISVGKYDEAPQTDSDRGLGPDTKLVTITIGGNNVGFADVLQTCYTNAQGCAAAKDGLDAKLGTVGAELNKTYLAIKSQAPNARLVVLTYPQLFRPDTSGTLCVEEARLGDYLTWLRDKTHQLDQIIWTEATKVGAVPVDMEDVTAGHEECTGDQSYVNQALGNEQVEWFHPNVNGQLAMEQRLFTALGQ